MPDGGKIIVSNLAAFSKLRGYSREAYSWSGIRGLWGPDVTRALNLGVVLQLISLDCAPTLLPSLILCLSPSPDYLKSWLISLLTLLKCIRLCFQGRLKVRKGHPEKSPSQGLSRSKRDDNTMEFYGQKGKKRLMLGFIFSLFSLVSLFFSSPFLPSSHQNWNKADCSQLSRD